MPSISAITPSTFDSGRSVTLSGSGFGASAGQVLIAGQAQTVTSWSDTSITFTTVRGSQSQGSCRVDVVKGVGAVPFFSDGFETGNLSYTQGGASWDASAASNDGSSVALVSGAGNPGYGLVFSYAGEADLAQTSRCEQFFDLGALYPEVTIEFDLYIPAGTESYGGSAYVHRDSTDSDNNKFIRLWHTTESVDEEKVGASLFRVTGDYSNINAEWGAAMGVNGQPSASFIRASDLGTWINVRFYAKAPSATANGTIKIWRNGVLIIDRTSLVNSYNASELHAYRYGYLLGTANSGFTDTTKLVIDNVKFYVGEV